MHIRDEFDAIRDKAEMLYDLGKYEALHEFLRQQLSQYPKNYYLLSKLALCLLQLDRYHEAGHLWQEAVAIDPEAEDAWIAGAAISMALGRIQDLKTCADQLLSLDPESHVAMCYLSIYYMELKKWYHAKEWIDKALTIEPDSVWAQSMQVRLLSMKGHFAQAKERALVYLRRHPDHQSLLAELALAQAGLNELDSSEQAADGALAHDPENELGQQLKRRLSRARLIPRWLGTASVIAFLIHLLLICFFHRIKPLEEWPGQFIPLLFPLLSLLYYYPLLFTTRKLILWKWPFASDARVATIRVVAGLGLMGFAGAVTAALIRHDFYLFIVASMAAYATATFALHYLMRVEGEKSYRLGIVAVTQVLLIFSWLDQNPADSYDSRWWALLLMLFLSSYPQDFYRRTLSQPLRG